MSISQGPYWCSGEWKGRLAIIARPRGNDWLSDELAAYRQAGFDLIVSLLRENEANELGLTDEARLSKENGLQFINFPIDDYGVPTSQTATCELVEGLLKRLKAGMTVGIHCRQSAGRSSLLAGCLSVLAGESPEAAFLKIQSTRGVPVPDTIEQQRFVQSFAKQPGVTK